MKLVLHKPSAAAKVVIPQGLADINKPGTSLLIALLTAATEKPDIKAARLAESFHEHADGGKHLHKLLTQDIPLDEDSNWTAQLQDTLNAIIHDERELRLETLTNKARMGLTDVEKKELRALLTSQKSI